MIFSQQVYFQDSYPADGMLGIHLSCDESEENISCGKIANFFCIYANIRPFFVQYLAAAELQ